MTKALTPYDTGTRLEPHIWVRPNPTWENGLGQFITGSEDVRASVDDDYGRVDFEDGGGITIVAGAYIEPDGSLLADGRPAYKMHLPGDDGQIIAVVVDSGEMPTLLVNPGDGGPELDTIERTMWRGQRLIDLGADALEDDPDEPGAGYLTQASDVIADLLMWASQQGVSTEALIGSALTAHREELRDFGLLPDVMPELIMEGEPGWHVDLLPTEDEAYAGLIAAMAYCEAPYDEQEEEDPASRLKQAAEEFLTAIGKPRK